MAFSASTPFSGSDDPNSHRRRQNSLDKPPVDGGVIDDQDLHAVAFRGHDRDAAGNRIHLRIHSLAPSNALRGFKDRSKDAGLA